MKKKSRGKKVARASRPFGPNQPRPGGTPMPLHVLPILGAALFVGMGVAYAAEDEETEPDSTSFEGGEKAFNNWIEFSAGGMLIDGNKSQAQQSRRLPDGAFGGISDFHYQGPVGTNLLLTVDGRGIYDHDYNLSVALAKEETWFLRVNVQNYRTWYNGDGGYYPPGDLWYPLAGGALGLDRGEISVEGGLTLDKWPALTFKYSHLTRDGEKSSTSWGQSHVSQVPSVTRGLNASFYDIDETRDIFELNAKHRVKSTDVGLGLRYETGDLNNARKSWQWRDEGPLAGESKITNREGTTYDLFNVHAFSETWLKKNLFFSTGFLFTDLDSDFSGSRIYGSDFDVGYAPNASNGTGYLNLNGGSHKHEYVGNLNLMYLPAKNLTITPSLRVQKEDWNAGSFAVPTLGNNPLPGSLESDTDGDALDVRERLDIRYTGITNCVLYAQGEWTQGEGSLDERGGLHNPGGTVIGRETEDRRFFQKYTLGCRLYPLRTFSVDVGGYYKKNSYDYDHLFDSTSNAAGGNRYPAFLVMQEFETHDGYTRLTWRPLPGLTLVSRYEYQISTIETQPDAASGLGNLESSEMTSHIIAQNVSWSPGSRLYFQVGFNYVLSESESPVSSDTATALDLRNGANFTKAILESQNNYWTLNFNSGLVLDHKTDLNLGYSYYRADNYTDYPSVSVPLGAGAEEHGVTATLVRRLNERVRVTLRYGYYHSEDDTSGGNNDYDAHVLFSSLQYRF